MSVERIPITGIKVIHRCDECGEGEMIHDTRKGQCYCCSSNLHKHVCNKCEAVKAIKKPYPFFVIDTEGTSN